MAHFAELDEKNIVIRVLVVPDEQEHRGQEYLANDLQLGGRWIQTSYNNRIRGRFAGIGFKYLPDEDIFIQYQPYPSWTLDENYIWQPPVPIPNDGFLHKWDEANQQWIKGRPL